MTDSSGYCLHSGLGYRLTLAARINSQRFESKIADLGITRQMWCLLVAVGEQNITLPSAIAQYIGINRTAASRTLRQMEERGHLQRSAGTGDKRTTRVEISAEGRTVLDAALPMAFEAQDELRNQLTEAEHDQLSTLLDKLLSNAAPEVSGI